MNDTTQPQNPQQAADQTQPQDSGGRRPDFSANTVRQGKNGKGYFNRIGAAWSHKDGDVYDVILDSVPVDGRVSLRRLRDARMESYNEEAAAAPQQTNGQGPAQDQGNGYRR